MMKYYGTIARSLIALLFVVAGIQKLQNFSGFAGMLGDQLGLPMPTLVAVIVIAIEIVVAALFAYGYKVREMGYTLMAFTALTILVVHRNFADPNNMVAALKNLAIIGGIMAAIACSCQDCVVHRKKGE